jgi:hypothetical protein
MSSNVFGLDKRQVNGGKPTVKTMWVDGATDASQQLVIRQDWGGAKAFTARFAPPESGWFCTSSRRGCMWCLCLLIHI